MTARDLTYIELTFEFPSSLEVEILQAPNCATGRMAFRLRDTEFALTLVEFNAIFCLPVGNERRPPREFEAHRLWSKVARVEFRTFDIRY
ncbi:hypothetical protein Lal_00042596 [Lupinus albus]|nr:hypothetical protein Lal_00042596 [Lupinus albus]